MVRLRFFRNIFEPFFVPLGPTISSDDDAEQQGHLTGTEGKVEPCQL